MRVVVNPETSGRDRRFGLYVRDVVNPHTSLAGQEPYCGPVCAWCGES